MVTVEAQKHVEMTVCNVGLRRSRKGLPFSLPRKSSRASVGKMSPIIWWSTMFLRKKKKKS